MKPEKWERIKDLFGLALEREPNQRAGFLEEACGGDPTLRAEVESLLASYHATEGPAGGANSLPDPTGASASEAADMMAGRRIGPYQVIREIGHGGMATVYLAVRADHQYRQRVAIKLVRPGPSGDEILRRFLNERQTLAALDHSNIVKLLDGGGTEEGLPYLVMEYVDGMPIDEYCDSRRLTITERLQLFRIVCGAVQYAHQNLVIHRDLKPANILVTSDGIPKLLDFGIAKLLNPEFSAQTLLVTQTGVRMMTPEYASPEQIRGLPLTTATDIYSLGVMLYQLSSGHRPYRLKNQTPLEIERAICEEEPEKPSTAVTRVAGQTAETGQTPEEVSRTREGRPEKLRRRLQGDLDNIVLMALRKEPQRRYASAEQFSEDIRRHLENLPVVARKPTLAYRAAKFTRRHTAGVASAALVVLVLIGGVITTTWQARVARVEKARAERRFTDVRRLANSFLFDFHNAIVNLPGSTPARRLVVDKAREYLDSLSQEAKSDPGLAIELATSYIRLGDVQGAFYFANLGETTGALASYRKAATMCEELCRANPKDAAACRCLGLGYRGRGEALWVLGSVRDAVDNLRKALPIFETLYATPSATVPNRLELVGCYVSLGDKLGNPTLLGLGLVFQGLEAYRKALALLEPMLAAQPADPVLRRARALTHGKLAQMSVEIGDVGRALNYFRLADTTFRQLSLADPVSARARRDLEANDAYFAGALRDAGDLQTALKASEEALRIAEDLRKADPKNVQMLGDVAMTHGITATILAKMGDAARGAQHYHTALAIIEAWLTADPSNILIRAGTAQGLTAFAGPLIKLGKVDEARRFTTRGLAMQRELVTRPEVTGPELEAHARALLTCEPPDLRDPVRAKVYAERAARLTNGENPRALDTLALAYFEMGDPARAVETEQKAVALLPAPESPNTHWGLRGEMESNLARFQAAVRHR